MKIKFYIVGIFVILLLSGCTSNLNINISNDGKVKESVNIYSPKSVITIENNDYGSILNSYIDIYKEDLITNNYNYNYDISNNNLNFSASKNYNDICIYFDSSLFIKNGGSFDCTQEDNMYKINGKISALNCDEDCFESPLVDDVKITISSKLKVLSENASEKEGNTYTWNFSKGSNDIFSLTLQKNKKDIIRNKIDSITSNKKVIALSILAIIGVLALAVLILMNKYKKNKIDY